MKAIKRKTLLYKSGVEYADFCLNHAVGCSHGCRFPCYAYQMARRFGWVKDYDDWTNPKIVSNALELLDKEIPKLKDKIKFVHLCFMTDPFMYKNTEIRDLTLKIIKKFNRNNIKCTVLTKGIYPKYLANKTIYGKENEYGITLVSLNPEFRKEFEPNSSPYNERIRSLKHLHDRGLKTWVSMEPYPTPNLDNKQDLLGLLDKIKFVDKIVFGKINYNAKSTHFKDNDIFFDECAGDVIEFCKKHKIEYHIKEGTQKKYNKDTEVVFIENKRSSPCVNIPSVSAKSF